MTKKIQILILVSFIFIFSCNKKPVQLPLIDIPGLSEIQNHSSIWIFLESVDGNMTAKLNKNNKILNTHWIFNIDRRLTMDQVIPILIEMQENRNKDSMHKKEGMKNYFSYADTATEKISLTPFPQTTFEQVDRNDIHYVQEPCAIILEIYGDRIKFNNEVFQLNSLASILLNMNTCDQKEDLKILLAYDEATSFQDYLRTKTFLLYNEFKCSAIEYVYTVK